MGSWGEERGDSFGPASSLAANRASWTRWRWVWFHFAQSLLCHSFWQPGAPHVFCRSLTRGSGWNHFPHTRQGRFRRFRGWCWVGIVPSSWWMGTMIKQMNGESAEGKDEPVAGRGGSGRYLLKRKTDNGQVGPFSGVRWVQGWPVLTQWKDVPLEDDTVKPGNHTIDQT